MIAKPFAQVRDEVRRRWLTERREAAVRTAAERLFAVWSAGKRDAAAERAMSFMREVGPVPVGVPVDTGAAAVVTARW